MYSLFTMTWQRTSSVRYSLPPMMMGTSSVWSRYFFKDSSRAARSGLRNNRLISKISYNMEHHMSVCCKSHLPCRQPRIGSFFTLKSETVMSFLFTTDAMPLVAILKKKWISTLQGRYTFNCFVYLVVFLPDRFS